MSRPDGSGDAPSGLRALQAWFHDAITEPRPVTAAAASARLRPNPALGLDEQLAIYREMYVLRIEGALADDYRETRRLLGPGRFRTLSLEYIAAHPSTSFTLEAIDGAFADFAASWRGVPDADRPALEEAVLVDVGAKQAAATADSLALDAAALAAVPCDDWERAVFVPAEGLRLLRLSRRARPRGLAIWRHAGAVRRLALSKPATAFLADLIDGMPLAAAVERLEIDAERAAVHVGRWLQRWVAAGFFARIETA